MSNSRDFDTAWNDDELNSLEFDTAWNDDELKTKEMLRILWKTKKSKFLHEYNHKFCRWRSYFKV